MYSSIHSDWSKLSFILLLRFLNQPFILSMSFCRTLYLTQK